MSVNPSAKGNAVLLLIPSQKVRAPNATSRTQAVSPRQPILLFVGSGMSRMARTMLRLEIRQDENDTVRKVRTTPRLNEITAVRRVTWGVKVIPNAENTLPAARARPNG